MKRLCIAAWLLAAGLSHAATAPANPPPTPASRLADPEFFALLDLSRPDLAAVREAAAKGDWPAARHALAEHMRHRPTPRWDLDPAAPGRERGRRDAAADRVLSHRLTSIGIEWQFGTNIDWAFNPTTQPGSKWPANHEWTWQLNRHSAWQALAGAYYATGDEKYARELAVELNQWVRDCPVRLDKAQNVSFSRWRTIEAGIRAGSVWPQIFPRVLAAKAFDDDTLLAMVRSYVDHAQYLMLFPTRGNWLTMEANGLYHAGALFPEFKDAKLWRDTAAGRLYKELDVQVYPDGAQMELAPGYHGVTIHNFLGPVTLVARTGFELPPEYLPKLEKMFAYFLDSMQPDRRTPPFNDSGANNIADYMATGAKLFPARKDFLWAATERQEGRAPDHTSHWFPYAGQFFMRSGWDPDARWLGFEGGPFGLGHQHEDKLNVILTAWGAPLLVEGGVYTYDASAWRRYVLSSYAHNVVLVDGLQQNRRKEPPSTYVVRQPLPQAWESNERFDYAAARYDEGWGPKAERLVTHTRRVFFLKPDLFVIADELEPRDGKAHSYDTMFHLDAPAAEVDGLRVSTRNSGPNLAVLASSADAVTIVQGQKEPFVQGWIPDRSEGYGGVRPIPTAVYTRRAEGRVTLLYALCPAKGPASCPVKEMKWTGTTLTVTETSGRTRTVEVKDPGLK